MLQEILKKLDLDEKEITLYLRLLRLGPNRASTLAYQIGLPRTTVQNILLRLEEEGLTAKAFEKNVAIYKPTHPNELVELVEMKKRKADYEFSQTLQELKKVMPELTSMMRSNRNVPGVRFYRGREGARKVLFDTLTSKTELKDFANVEAMFNVVKDINDEYVAEREKTTITKRSLLLDTPFARQIYESKKYSPKSHKGYKWIPADKYPFSLEMNIYDGRISYITYVQDDFVGVIIENEHIYRMHDSMWNLLWDVLPSPS